MASSLQAGRLCEELLEAAPWCTWAIRPDLTFHLIYGNPLPLFGIPASGLTGRKLADVLPPQTRDIWQQRAERVFAGERLSLREQAASGLVSAVWYPVREGGEIAFAAGAAMDMSPLSTSERGLRHTALKVLQARESERTRLARFLHDEVGQCLSAAGLQLDLLRMDLEPVLPDIPARTAEVQQVLERVMERVREFTHELNPATVERAGLYSALDRMIGRLRRGFGGTVRLMADSSVRLEAAAANALYRIAEQALDNALRHSGCTAIEVHLKATRPGPSLEVRDNGAGFDPAGVEAGNRGLGLLIMEYCAADAGIELTVSSLRGRGTSVRALVRAAAAADD